MGVRYSKVYPLLPSIEIPVETVALVMANSNAAVSSLANEDGLC